MTSSTITIAPLNMKEAVFTIKGNAPYDVKNFRRVLDCARRGR